MTVSTTSNTLQSNTTTQSKNTQQTTSSFSNFLDSSETTQSQTVTINDTTKNLVENIMSVLRTGFTKDELEYIEKLLQLIREKIEEESKTREVSKSEIEAMFQEVERTIRELKKSRTGSFVLDASDETKDSSSGSTLETFQERLQNIQKSFEEMLTGNTKKKNNTQLSYEELKLIEELKKKNETTSN